MCYRPITIKNPADGTYMQVPCGKCLDCLRKYQNSFAIRMQEEFKAKGYKGVFFTLTYDDKHVPKNYLADGVIYRSSPDYAYSNVTLDKFNREVAPFRTRKKYAEFPHAVLQRYGVLDDRGVQDILDFNNPSNKNRSARSKWFKDIQNLFVKQLALSVPPPRVVESFKANEAFSLDDLDSRCSIELMDGVDQSSWWNVDEDTGELFPVNEVIPETDFDKKVQEYYHEETPIISFNSVRKEDVQLWLKRNRSASKRSNPDFNFSYFITSEYGPRTLRPHYHGVLFGVSKDDVSEWFRDWQRHYGEIVVFDNLDPNKGGLSYVAKYCSKGVFEHPLCCKDFFYFYRRITDYQEVVCNEYHSKSYEKCFEWFGIDAPIVDKTFHLFSKGLGISYCKDEANLKYLRCREFEDITRENFGCNYIDSCTNSFVFHDSLGVTVDALLSGDSFDEYCKKAYEADFSTKTNDWLSRFVKRARIFRNCKVKNRQTGAIEEKCFAFAIPRYYRKVLFGRNLQIAYPHFIQQENERLYKEKLECLASSFPSGKDSEVVLELERLQRQEIVDKFNRCFESQKRFIEKSQL